MKSIFCATRGSAIVGFIALAIAGSAVAFGEPDPAYKPEGLSGATCSADRQALAADGGVFTSTFRFMFPDGQNGVVRHRADGSIDRSWGKAGEVNTNVEPLQLQTAADGGLFAIGTNISRFKRDGAVDETFGSAGISDTILPARSALRGAAQQPDGSLVTLTSSATGREFIRTNSRGLRDTSFGTNGYFTIPFALVPSDANVYAWSVERDGSVVLAWYQKVTGSGQQPQFEIKRFRKELAVADPSFDAGGRLVPRQGVADWLSALAKVQADGALLLATYDCVDATCAEPAVAVRRYDAFGSVDASYGTGGKTTFRLLPNERDPRSFATATQMSLGNDGKLTVLMHGQRRSGEFGIRITGILAYRLDAGGKLDPAFENGKVVLNVQYATFMQLNDGSLLRPRPYSPEFGCAPQKYLTDSPRTAAVAVEYYSPSLDHYFITAHEFEKVIVDTGMAGDWRRTGQAFGAFSIDASMPGTSPVCRYYSGANGGAVSHFFSAEKFECDILANLEAQTPPDKPAWRFELNAFRITVPVNAACPPNLTPLYRLYNNGAALGKSPNHRYTTDLNILAAMQTKGWFSEGVRMCMPPANRSDRTQEFL